MCKNILQIVVSVGALLQAVSGLDLASAAPVRGSIEFYDFVEADVTWHEARAMALASTYLGQQGRLATLRTGRENTFVLQAFGRDETNFLAWIGGYEPVENEIWLWADGPDAGQQMSLGEHPVPPTFYANWGGAEPTDSGGVGHDYAAMNLGRAYGQIATGQWLATPAMTNTVRGFLVEYSLPEAAPEPGAGALVCLAFVTYFLRYPRQSK